MPADLLIIHEKGSREINEDAYRIGVTPCNDHFFILCDGVGGATKGEVASKLACDTISEFLCTQLVLPPFEEYINQLTACVDAAFDNYIYHDTSAKGMATTLALLVRTNHVTLVAHVGDSRVYHIRNGKLLFQTRDHSLVNEMVDGGFISPADLADYPPKNIITRAIQGAQTKKAKADIQLITDVRPGDYFFLCSDGVLESIDTDSLLAILQSATDDNDKIGELRRRCAKQSKDNYTAILVSVK